MLRRAVILIACLAAAAPAGAARPVPQDTVVEALVVTAARRSPPWWRVTNGESVVWIMGGPMGPLPKDLKWDEHQLDARLEGARGLIVPSGASIGLGDIFGLLRLRGQLKEEQPLEAALPQPEKARFVAARTALGKDAGRYGKWGPVWAGRLLLQDYLDRWDLRGTNVTGRVRDLARRHHVATERATHKAMPVLRSAVSGMKDEEKALHCLDGYLEAVELDPERYRAAARGWAVGEVREAIDLPRGADVCRELFTDGFTRTSIQDEVEAITAALQAPGSSVAIVPLRQLLLKDGVLQQLKARGFEITDPASLHDD